jgi:hypothetical protein
VVPFQIQRQDFLIFLTEYLLVGGIVGLYLYDSAVLLYCNEAVLVPCFGGRWQIGFASDRFAVMGKDVYIPNPFTPHRAIYRIAWSTENSGGAPWMPPFRSIPFLRESQWGVAISLLVVLPLGLFSQFGNEAVALAVVMAYLNIAIGLIAIWVLRESLGCSNSRFFSLAFEVLTCPPFAINLTRHLSLSLSRNGDLLATGRALLSQEDWDSVKSRLLTRIENTSDWEAEGSVEHSALRVLKDKLSSETK